MAGKLITTAFTALALVPFLASAEIYRWVDENGKVHYSDKAPPGVKVEKRSYSNVATPFRKAPSDLYLKDEESEAEEGEEASEETTETSDSPEGVEEQNADQEDQIEEELLTDEEREALEKKRQEEDKKIKEDYEKAKEALRKSQKAKKDRAAETE